MFLHMLVFMQEIFVLAMEFLEDVSHFNSAETAHEVWTSKDIEVCVSNLLIIEHNFDLQFIH